MSTPTKVTSLDQNLVELQMLQAKEPRRESGLDTKTKINRVVDPFAQKLGISPDVFILKAVTLYSKLPTILADTLGAGMDNEDMCYCDHTKLNYIERDNIVVDMMEGELFDTSIGRDQPIKKTLKEVFNFTHKEDEL